MRLISQNGMIDVTYENVCVSINHRDKNQIIAWNFGCEDWEIATMATYSTEAKALKVMEMLRKVYSQFEITKIVACGSSEQISKQLSQKEAEIVISDFWKMATFQFPNDDDVEV